MNKSWKKFEVTKKQFVLLVSLVHSHRNFCAQCTDNLECKTMHELFEDCNYIWQKLLDMQYDYAELLQESDSIKAKDVLHEG